VSLRALSRRRRPSHPSIWQRLHERHPVDAVDALTVWLFVSYCIPSPLIVGPIGGAGTPGNLLGVGFLVWWAAAKIGSGLGVDRGRQPVRIALLCFFLPVLTSIVAMFMRPTIGKEVTGAERGLLYCAALVGVAVFAADGIADLDRVHVLARRVVGFAAFVASLGIVQFVTGWNPAGRLSIPGLARNLSIQNQDRSVFLRVQSTTLHPIELGTLMGIVLPIALTYAFLTRGRWPKRLAWAQVLLIAAVLPMALTRTGVIAALVGLVAIAADWTWKRRAEVLAAGVAFLAVMRLAVPGLLGTVFALFSDLTQDNSTIARLHRYQAAGHYLLQHLWFGRGINTLYPVTQQVWDNSYLGLVVEQGIVGLIGWALVLGILFFTARGARRRSSDPATSGLSQAMAGIVVAVGIAFYTADLGAFTILMGTVFLFAGMIGALWRLTGGPAAGPGAPVAAQPRAAAKPRRTSHDSDLTLSAAARRAAAPGSASTTSASAAARLAGVASTKRA